MYTPVLAPRALDRSSVDELTLKLNDSHGGVLVRVELDESESSVGLHPNLDDVAVALRERSREHTRTKASASKGAEAFEGEVVEKSKNDAS